LRVEDLPQGLRERILSRAEGNPFYVEEIIRSLIDDRTIVRDEATGRWEATREVANIAIPDTLQGVLMARIDRLHEETKRVLQMAAVIGRIFLYRVLSAIAQEERELDRQLLTLQREEMIRERARLPELEYIFKHELTREAAYNGLLKKERRIFHRQVAEALERLFPERVDEQVGLLAHHWEQAGEAEKATAYLLRAADQARTLYAHQEAIDFYERALVFLREGEDLDQAARTLMKLGLTYHTAFEFRRSREAYDEGFALWQKVARKAPHAALPSAPHPLRLVEWEPETLDPGRSNSWETYSQHFRRLVELGPELEVMPDLALSWEVLEGGRRYIFHLREDAQWSDGRPVTAHDVEFAWKRVLDPGTGAPCPDLLFDLKGAEAYHRGEVSDPALVGVRALDDTTLLVDLESPTGYFLQLLTQWVTSPVPRHVVEAHGEVWAEPANIVTNGPFALAEYRPGESLVLVRNAHYRGGWPGNVERVEIALLGFSAWRETMALYEADELDALKITSFPVEQRDRLRRRHPDEFISVPQLSTGCFGFNVTRPPLHDVRVRRALTLAADKEVLAGVSFRGYALPPTGGFVPPGMPGHSPGIGLPYDPERARQLLAEAGYPGGRGFPALRGILPSGSGSSIAAADYWRAQWQRELSVEVRWEYVPGSEEQDRVQQEQPHITLYVWVADYPDPDNFLRIGFGGERTAWRNAEYDELVARARGLLDQEERMSLYRRADRIIVEEAPFMLGVYMQSQVLVKPWVKGYSMSGMGAWSPWKDTIIEPH
jgi:ABC-type oligopeptide transport system substrate-binding subunit